jgi:hypothetical protein
MDKEITFHGGCPVLTNQRWSFWRGLWNAIGAAFLNLWFRFGLALATNSPTIIGDNTVLWGTAALIASPNTAVSGILVSVRDQRTGEMVEIPDENGFSTTVIFFNSKNECEFHVVVKTAFPTWDRGSKLTVNGHTNVYVTDYEKLWENKKCAEYNVKGTAWDGIS